MKIENLYVGQVIKGYEELCKLLGIKKYKSGSNSQKAQFKNINNHILLNKEKIGRTNYFTVMEIYKVSKDDIDNRKNNKGNIKYAHILSPKELSNEFDGFYVYRHIHNGEVIYVGKGSKKRVVRGYRKGYDIKKVEKEIVKRFDDELESILFEKQLIEYYKSLGQCKYNSDDYYTGSFVNKELKNKIKIKSKPKKVNKQKCAYELLENLGYEFDEYGGWRLK